MFLLGTGNHEYKLKEHFQLRLPDCISTGEVYRTGMKQNAGSLIVDGTFVRVLFKTNVICQVRRYELFI